MQLQATPQDVLVQGSSPRHRLTPEGLGREWMRCCLGDGEKGVSMVSMLFGVRVGVYVVAAKA